MLVYDPNVCPKDGALLREDLDFLRAAQERHIEVRRLVGLTCGHSIYLGPDVAARGWMPRRASERRCDQCGGILVDIPKRSHGRGARRCRACRGLPARCTACGQPMDEGSGAKKTCSEACRTVAATAALAKLRERRAGCDERYDGNRMD